VRTSHGVKKKNKHKHRYTSRKTQTLPDTWRQEVVELFITTVVLKEGRRRK
jgi:hypothetical protein